jgi:ubiquinone/menaquinone biosynthesis C-methylase UbiE
VDVAEIDEMAALEANHWWFVGKRLIVRALLGPRLGRPGLRVLDVGCGTGGVLAHLADAAAVVGIDRSPEAVAHCRRRGLMQTAVSDGHRLPFADRTFDAVLLLDVLEHFADEQALLAEVRRLLRPGGMMLVSVPAYQFLWSEHDEVLHHVRRYTAPRLRAALEGARLAVERLTYTNVVPLVPACVVRGVLPRLGVHRPAGTDFRRHAPWVNRALVAGYRLEAAALSRMRMPAGLSVAAVARVAPVERSDASG